MPHAIAISGENKILYWFCGRYAYASVVLPKTARILEVGGGQDPHPAADVLVEKFFDTNIHRMMNTNPVFEGPIYVDNQGVHEEIGYYKPTVIQADVVNMPFEDKSFDFVITKDILEHVPDIQAACQEIGRVGKAGFIDVPRLESEWLFPNEDAHRWVFDVKGNTLIAREIQFTSPFGKDSKILHRLFAENGEFQDAWARSRYYFHVVCMWRDCVPLTIGESAAYVQVPSHEEETVKKGWVEGVARGV